MKKFFSKKDKSADEYDPNREALFGGRAQSPAPSYKTNDPYAQQPGHQQGYNNYQPAGPSGYAAQQQRPQNNQRAPTNDDPNRNALFDGMRTGTPQGGMNYPQYGNAGSGQPGYGGYQQQRQSAVNDYVAYGGRRDEEQEEDEDVEAVKQEMRFTKQESLSSTRNAVRMAAEAEETGRNTLARLGAQSDRISNVERSLDIAANASHRAEEKARELKTLNRSMFAVHVAKPWGRAKRQEEEELRITERHEAERNEREANRKYAYDSQRRVDAALSGQGQGKTTWAERKQASLAERSKYQFEADEQDDEVEKEIDSNLDTLSGVASRLRGLAVATNEEITMQNAKLDRIGDKGDNLDTRMHLNTERLKRIR
ncbi:Protein transport protein S9 plasma membrane t-SNARE [Saitoella coloradoensis]